MPYYAEMGEGAVAEALSGRDGAAVQAIVDALDSVCPPTAASRDDILRVAAGRVGEETSALACARELVDKDTGWRLLGSGSSDFVLSDVGTVTFSYRFVARRIGALSNAWWTVWQSGGPDWDATALTGNVNPSAPLSRIVPAEVLREYPHQYRGLHPILKSGINANSGGTTFPTFAGGYHVQARALNLSYRSDIPLPGARQTRMRGYAVTDAPFPATVQGTLVANEAGDPL